MGEQSERTRVAQGRVLDHGAHVVSWVPAGHEPVLWVSRHAVFEPGTAVRGGVPICFPWFGGGRTGDLRPSHGFARIAEWPLGRADVKDEILSVEHVLTEREATCPDFPWSYRAVSRVRFAETLDMELEIVNTDTAAFSFETALHTYLSVGDVNRIEIHGLDGAPYRDKVLGAECVQSGAVRFAGEVDRVYDSSTTVDIHDPVLSRTITVAKNGSASTIVWNPWRDRAHELADFGDDEWPGMVCVESGNVGAGAVMLEPGQQHLMSVRISVEASRAPGAAHVGLH